MKKLEDIPKKEIFEVPEGYFEKLPAIIQARLTPHESELKGSWSTYRYSLRFGLPVLILLVAGLFWFNRPQTEKNAEHILASLETQDLVAYLGEADFTTEELLEAGMLDGEDVAQIEDQVYEFKLSDTDIENIFDDID